MIASICYNEGPTISEPKRFRTQKGRMCVKLREMVQQAALKKNPFRVGSRSDKP